jgi:hypothetical protein
MHQLLLLVLAIVLTTGKSEINKKPVSCVPPAKCYGYSPCNTCSNCSACAHCVDGRTCGVCSKEKTEAKAKASDHLSLYEAPVSSANVRQ